MLCYNRVVNPALLEAPLQVVESIVVIAAAVAVVAVVWWGFALHRKLLSPATRVAENLAALTGMARDEELPRKVSRLFDELRKAAESVAVASKELQRFLADEEFVALPAETRQAVARFQESLERFNATLSQVDTYLKLPEDAKQKFNLLRQVVSAIGDGISAGWEDLRRKQDPEGK